MRLPFVEHPWRLILAMAVICGLCTLAFVGGTFVRAPEDSLRTAADADVFAYVPAEERVVAEGVTVQGAVVAGQQIAVIPASVEGRRVVTEQPMGAGAEIQNLAHLASVSGRPLFAVMVPVPLYRDIRAGDVGADVESLQVALGLAVTGKANSALEKRLVEIYAAVGAEPPGGRSDPVASWTELVSFPVSGFAARVRSAASLGEVLTTDAPVLSASVAPNEVLTRVNVNEVDMTPVGAPVLIRGDGVTTPGRVIAVGDFSAATSAEGTGASAGFDLRIAPDDANAVADQIGKAVTISTSIDSQPTTAVPLSALREDTTGTFLLVKSDGSPSASRVDVMILRKSDGWAAVESSLLEPGDLVEISR